MANKSGDMLPFILIGIGAYFLLQRPTAASFAASPSLPAPSRKPPTPSGGSTGFTGSNYNQWIQSSLNYIMGCGLTVDGIIGPQTRDCIKRFQQSRLITVDGIVGKETDWEIHSALGETGYVESPNPYTPGAAQATDITGWY